MHEFEHFNVTPGSVESLSPKSFHVFSLLKSPMHVSLPEQVTGS